MARPKVIVQLYPMLPTESREEREQKRPLARDKDLYHHVLHEWVDIVKAADEMGVWGVSTIEHHLHSEGYEVGPNPGVLNAWWAAQVKNARVGALGYVMATQDPIRVAEETAILDHITKGKFFCGVARGYQSRWANILGQFSDTRATVSSDLGGADDVQNRDIFEERVEMLLKFWQEDSVEVKGAHYEIPYPYEEGIDYPAWRSARDAGAIGEVGDGNRVRRVSVVPKALPRALSAHVSSREREPGFHKICGETRIPARVFHQAGKDGGILPSLRGGGGQGGPQLRPW